MKNNENSMSRRKFLAVSGAIAGTSLASPASNLYAGTNNIRVTPSARKRIALVGTGIRGMRMFGQDIVRNYSDYAEFVALCDINPGRLAAAKNMIGVDCPTYTDFDRMMRETNPELVFVITDDDAHEHLINRAMELGANVVTEKPMAIDEKQIQSIIDADKTNNKTCQVAFNYRYAPIRAAMWEVLRSGELGELTSVDFNWYLDHDHGARYFRRWHRLMEKGGSLWVHKATHHFDLLNWWIDSDPEVVYALGDLNVFGKNGPFRAPNCRSCPHTRECRHYWDITRDNTSMRLYVDNEHYDGYLRDGCVYRNDVNIFDKHTATIGYKNGVQAAYSLVCYSPYAGYRIGFSGTKGRMDAFIEENNPLSNVDFDQAIIFPINGRRRFINMPKLPGHSGGDKLLMDQIFIPGSEDPYKSSAGIRDGALSCLVGIAARKSVASGQPVKIEGLTSIVPQVQKEYQRKKV
jgi:predicted dehydrogenase